MDGLKIAIEQDEGKEPQQIHPLLKNVRCFNELLIAYIGVSPSNPVTPLDGSHITTSLIGLLQSSRGSVKLNSSHPNDNPVIDPQYFSTNVDSYTMREGLRTIARLILKTPQGSELIENETPPDNFAPVSLNSLNDYLDARVRASTM